MYCNEHIIPIFMSRERREAWYVIRRERGELRLKKGERHLVSGIVALRPFIKQRGTMYKDRLMNGS